ncbi:MAG: hypothetical protein M1434_15210 [Chloroflexi bacterium]|nr:hypothetical protein [Chloroflexota bacterium]MCL5276070.1 hypothetical protein [Chloroflexota bacterium]
MTDRTTRTIQIVLPGGRTSPESLADIIDTIFGKGVERGERIDSVRAYMGSMAETMTIDVVLSAPVNTGSPFDHDSVDDRRR